MPRRLKCTSFRLDPEDNDTFTTLVGNEAELARRVDIEVSRRFDIGGLVLDESQCPFSRIDSINYNAVVPPV